MKPRHFFDIEIAGCEQGSVSTPVVCGIVVHILHGVFRNLPGQYAIAFPHPRFFSTVRVFASERTQLDVLVDAIRQHGKIRDYTRLGYPQSIPDDFQGRWVEHRRYRIPTRKSDRRPGAPLRVKRIAAAEENGLPYLMMRSKSTGSQFGLYIETLIRQESSPNGQEAECQPDSYGLSVRDRSFALPLLP